MSTIWTIVSSHHDNKVNTKGMFFYQNLWLELMVLEIHRHNVNARLFDIYKCNTFLLEFQVQSPKKSKNSNFFGIFKLSTQEEDSGIHPQGRLFGEYTNSSSINPMNSSKQIVPKGLFVCITYIEFFCQMNSIKGSIKKWWVRDTR